MCIQHIMRKLKSGSCLGEFIEFLEFVLLAFVFIIIL